MVVGVSLIKDEADIVAQTVGHMLAQVDHVIVADNGSTDGTRQIVEGLGADVRDDPELGYYQSRKMSALASEARSNGAEWVVPFDADEVWLAADGTVAETLARLPGGAHLAEAAVFDHMPTGLDRNGHGPVSAIGWRRGQQLPLRKVACRAVEGLVIHQGNHGATFPGVEAPLTVTGQLQVRHFPYRSVGQMIRKARNGAAAYAATDLGEDMGAHWRGYGRLSDEQLGDAFRRHFWSADPEADGLVFDPAL